GARPWAGQYRFGAGSTGRSKRNSPTPLYCAPSSSCCRGFDRKEQSFEREADGYKGGIHWTEARVSSLVRGEIGHRGGHPIEERIALHDWTKIHGELDEQGCAVMPGLLG